MEKGEERKKFLGNHTASTHKVSFDFGRLGKQQLFILGVIPTPALVYVTN
jgi:hypothetical protein